MRLKSAERQRTFNQFTALGNSWPTTETQERFARAHESDDVAEVEDNSVEAVPDHHIED